MHFLRSLTAKVAMSAKEKKSFTAEAAVHAKCKVFEPTPRENAKTTPSMEWPHRACDWGVCNGTIDPYRSGRYYLPWRCLGALGVEIIVIFFAPSTATLSRAFRRVLARGGRSSACARGRRCDPGAGRARRYHS